MTVKSRAAVMWESNQPLDIRTIDVDDPGPGEVRIKMVSGGVCHSDLHTLDGSIGYPMPTVLGHEGAGTVESLGAGVTNVEIGDSVLLSWVPSCGHCPSCASGHPNLCETLEWSDNGTMQDGNVRLHADGQPVHHYTISSFAEYSVVPAASCIKVDNDLDLEDLALLGCAVMTGIGAVINTAKVQPGDVVAVVGCGGVGLNVIQGAVLAGASTIVAIDISESALTLATDLGATHTFNAANPDITEEVRRATANGVDHSFEVLGKTSTIELAVSLTRRRGQTILIGMAAPDARPKFDALQLTMEEKSILGCWYGSCRPAVDFPKLVDFYRTGRIRLDGLTRRIELDDINEAFDDLRQGVPGRAVIVY